MEINDKYWENRYLKNDNPWNLKKITPPLESYINQLIDKKIKILIPGAGFGHEATYLHQKGFKNVYLLDFAKQPLDAFQLQNPDFPDNHIICNDFFKIDGQFDLILEQTFFCALDPNLIEAYVNKMFNLLSPAGKLVGVLFNDFYNNSQPPFGATKEEYLKYFSTLFNVKYFDICYNSVDSRLGREFFFILTKKIL